MRPNLAVLAWHRRHGCLTLFKSPTDRKQHNGPLLSPRYTPARSSGHRDGMRQPTHGQRTGAPQTPDDIFALVPRNGRGQEPCLRHFVRKRLLLRTLPWPHRWMDEREKERIAKAPVPSPTQPGRPEPPPGLVFSTAPPCHDGPSHP